jgi:hypothetical protein
MAHRGEYIGVMRHFVLTAGFAVALVTCHLSAQSIPPYVPANPLLESRSALYSQPFVQPSPGWHWRWLTDYYNAVETATSPDAARSTTFDAEVLQSDLWLTHDLSRHVFVLGNVAVRGGYDGFLDAFLIWYHHFIGLAVPARDELPHDTFQWHTEFPDTIVDRSAPGTFLGDVRAGIGVRFGRAQLVASATLPTATSKDGWVRHVIGTSLALTAEPIRSNRVIVDASISGGYTPTQGGLAPYQKSWFGSAMLATRWRFAGQQAVYGTLWAQSSNWQQTGFVDVDDAEVIGDFGFLLHVAKHWPELQLGLTEDMVPKGPAMDIGFAIGLRW